MSAIFRKIEVGQDFSERGIQQAIKRNVDTILRLNMSRFAYAHATLKFETPRQLPLLHVMDHRVRLPALQLDHCSDDSSQNSVVEDRLNRMLCVTAHRGGRELLCDALDLEPRNDAITLVQIAKVSPKLFSNLMRGRLGDALKLSRNFAPAETSSVAVQAISARLLVYHCAHQVQMLAARGSSIDRFAFSLKASGREQMQGAIYGDAWQVLDTLELIIRKLTKETRQKPQRAFYKDLEGRSEEIQADLDLSEEEMTTLLKAVLVGRRQAFNEARSHFDVLRNQPADSFHKTIFGLTSFQTLIFAVTRLVQLKHRASTIVGEKATDLSGMIPFAKKQIPSLEDEAVSKAFLVYRSLVLRDSDAEEIYRNDGSEVNLVHLWNDMQAGGDNYGATAFADVRASFGQIKRDLLGFPMAKRLAAGQQVDILPDFILQKGARKPRVRGVPHAHRALAMAMTGYAKNQSHRPPNVNRMPRRK